MAARYPAAFTTVSVERPDLIDFSLSLVGIHAFAINTSWLWSF